MKKRGILKTERLVLRPFELSDVKVKYQGQTLKCEKVDILYVMNNGGGA